MPAIDWTYAVTDSATTLPLEGVNIWASSDLEGLLVLDTGVTNAAGQVVLSLEQDSDVYIWHSLAGYTFTNPNLQTVTLSVTGTGQGTAIVLPVPDAIAVRYTVNDLIKDSFQEIGILALGEELLIEDARFGLRRLNMMLDSWRTERLLAYTIAIDRYTLTANQAVHTIGPSGDFVAERPTRITHANLVFTNISPEQHQIIQIIEKAEEWARISLPSQASNHADYLYCDYAYPDASIYLYPVINAAYDLELFTWQELKKFLALTQVLLLPPGYYEAIMLSLAEKLCSSYGVPLETRGLVKQDASMARAKIKSLNSRAPLISTVDCGMPTVLAP